MKTPIEQLHDLLEVQGRQGTWDSDPYMLGVFNGLELAAATMDDREPHFRSATQGEVVTVLSYATRLAEAIWRKHYATDAPNWKPLPDLMGVLTQIDNMTNGLATSRTGESVPCPQCQPDQWR